MPFGQPPACRCAISAFKPEPVRVSTESGALDSAPPFCPSGDPAYSPTTGYTFNSKCSRSQALMTLRKVLYSCCLTLL